MKAKRNEFAANRRLGCNINVIQSYTNKLITQVFCVHGNTRAADNFIFYRQHAHLCGPAFNSLDD